MQGEWNGKLTSIWFAAFLLALGGCGADEATITEDGTKSTLRGVTDTEIVLGAHTDLSGPAAIWGVGSINGARMRFDEVNAAGGIDGRQIHLIVEDTAYQVPRAIQAANKLLHRDQIFAMMLAGGTQINNTVLSGQMEAMESFTDYTDMFGYKISFGPDDHKGVSESVLSVVENGRWVTKAESASY